METTNTAAGWVSPFTAEVKAICAKHWPKKNGERCVGCPIVVACHASTPTTREGIDAHARALNAAAAALVTISRK